MSLGELLGDPYDEAWMNEAACQGANPDLFFPERDNDARACVTAAKAVCATCTVVAPCLEYALANNERWGVWGNTSERERRRIKRGRMLRRLGRSA
jgi:WhiB family redox-sensing transcriptional regulator